MKRLLTFIIIGLAVLLSGEYVSEAREIILLPTDLKAERADRNLAVGMTLDLGTLPVGSNMSVRITPVLNGAGGERCELPSVTVAGRSRYYTMKRNDNPASREGMFYRHSRKMSPLNYTAMVPYKAWMRTAEISIETEAEGCCGKGIGRSAVAVSNLKLEKTAIEAGYAFVTPKAERMKIRRKEGSALIDFKVNQTVILPDFGRNPGELAKIRQSIDEVRDDADTKILSVDIHGYASPEGSYANNERLAKGRTEALAGYVRTLYSFPAGMITTASTAEDWEGVRRFLLDNPAFENRDAILAIVDSDIDPDSKNDRIKAEYPVAYRYMLENVYPPLRHSDYRIEYEVRSYTDPKEIAEVFRTRPANLSLEELFILANSLPEGSDEYADVFETAVRLFPDSEVAALNAAFAAIKRGDYVGAARHLENAGDSPEATYARGLVKAGEGDYEGARTLLEEAKALGVAPAEKALQSLSILEAE